VEEAADNELSALSVRQILEEAAGLCCGSLNVTSLTSTRMAEVGELAHETGLDVLAVQVWSIG